MNSQRLSQLIAHSVASRSVPSILPTKTFLRICREEKHSTLDNARSAHDKHELAPSSATLTLDEILERKSWENSQVSKGTIKECSRRIEHALNAASQRPGIDQFELQPYAPIFNSAVDPPTLSSLLNKCMPCINNPVQKALQAWSASCLVKYGGVKTKIRLQPLDARLLEYEHLQKYLQITNHPDIPKSFKGMLKAVVSMEGAEDLLPPFQIPNLPEFDGKCNVDALLMVVSALASRKHMLLNVLSESIGLIYTGEHTRLTFFWEAVKTVLLEHGHFVDKSTKEIFNLYKILLSKGKRLN